MRDSTSPRAERRPRPGVFLDRDGTIVVDRHYPADPAEVELMPGAAEAIARLNRAGLPVLIVTNQSGIGRGLLTPAEFAAVQARTEALLAAEGAHVDGVYHCPHRPDEGCACRKPGTELFLAAAEEHGIDLSSSFFVGDRLRDVVPGLEWGARGFLVSGAEEETPPAAVESVQSLDAAVNRILGCD